MSQIDGIGGLFVRARDPEALGQWYETHFGLKSGAPFTQASGPTVFATFAQASDYFPADRQWMVNFRVADMDATIARLQAADIAVETRPDEWDHPEVGRFARIHDPEGNPIELWQPPE
jgi:predicted enzyme related to lactoylglutathione lyase